MKLKQLSLFIENRPGHMTTPFQALLDSGVNILTLSLADTQQFGILRLIVNDWEAGKKALEAAGCVVNVTEVVAIEVEDRPGGLYEILSLIDKDKINVEYMYAFTFGRNGKAALIFRFEDPDQAIRLLQENGINVIGSVDLYSRTSS
ncbi:MAG: amino acid-binding protein [FCB group bacterium]|jgi:hypothetical protein|nr:amino acid-binding protein [FCB group bacterium]